MRVREENLMNASGTLNCPLLTTKVQKKLKTRQTHKLNHDCLFLARLATKATCGLREHRRREHRNLTILGRNLPRMTRFATKNVVESYLNVQHIGQRRFAASETQRACTSDIGRAKFNKNYNVNAQAHEGLIFGALPIKICLYPSRAPKA